MKKNIFEKKTSSLIRLEESNFLDFKETPQSITGRDLISFANANGGIILIGIKETESKSGIQKGKIVGCEVSDKIKRSIVQKAKSCIPSVDINISNEIVNKKNLLRVEIFEGKNKPYCTSSGDYRIRSGSLNDKIDPFLMKQIILESEVENFTQRFSTVSENLLISISNAASDILEATDDIKSAVSNIESIVENFDLERDE